MNFGELKAALLAEIGRAPSSVVYQLVTADINRVLRISEMVETTTLTEAASITLPTGFLGVVRAYLDTDPRVALTPTTGQALDRMHYNGNTAREYAIEDGVMYLNPTPTTSETIHLTYYKRVADLSADTDTNDILANHPAIYIYGALTHHAALKQDAQKAALWKAAYDIAIDGAMESDIKTKNAGAPLKVAVGTAP
jgi:hypothetical protein